MSDGQTDYTLRIYLRPTTALPPPAFGPLGLTTYILKTFESSSANFIKIETADGQTGDGKEKTCLLISNSSKDGEGSIEASDPSDSIKKISSIFEKKYRDDFKLGGRDEIGGKKVEEILRVLGPLLSDHNNLKNMSSISEVAKSLEAILSSEAPSDRLLGGDQVSIADFTLWGLIKSSSTFNALLKRPDHPRLSQWFNSFDKLPTNVSSVEFLKDQIKNLAKGRSKAGVASVNFDGGLKNGVKGQVVTRFPPEPSGYLHIGHCKAAILNQHYAKIYDGKFIVRFDDTNPSKEKEEFQDSILEDLKLLGITGDKISYTSDYFDLIYNHAIELIKAGKAFCDDTEQEQMKAERLAREPSKRRDSSVSENLERFEAMKIGSEDGLRWCLRAKIKFDDLNGTLRDPVIYRCNLLPHHRTGEKWKIYPTYDFACPIVDSIEGVTHALRTNEYRDRNPQYWWMQKSLGLRKVEIKDFARVNFVYTLLSKRKLKWFVETGKARGWDDPRFATVRGIRRRGMTIQAMRDFMISQGDNQQQVNMEWDSLWSLNKRIIDPIVPRHTVIVKENMVIATIRDKEGKDLIEFKVENLLSHKKNPELGKKKVLFGPKILIEQDDAKSFEIDEEITLMDWGNAIVRKKIIEHEIVTRLELDLNLEGDFKKTKKKIHWLSTTKTTPSESSSNPIDISTLKLTGEDRIESNQDVIMLDYDYLITKKKIEEDDEIEDFITPVSEFKSFGTSDGNIKSFKKGEILQFERKGYYIVDKALGEESTLGEGLSGKDFIELIRIPDGRAAGIASKASNPTSTPNTGNESKKSNKKSISKTKKVEDSKASKMYEVEPIYKNDEGLKEVETKMYSVDSIYS